MFVNILIGFIVFLVLTYLFSKQYQQIEALKGRVNTLESKINRILGQEKNSDWKSQPDNSDVKTAADVPASQTVQSIKSKTSLEVRTEKSDVNMPPKGVKLVIDKKKAGEKSAFWKKFESVFVENWMGIAAAAIFIIGVSILGIYAAAYFPPFYRFLVLVGVSLVLFAAFWLLRKRPLWVRLAAWLRSISGAVLLFACFGSGGIPGLKWVENPLIALLLLCMGIAVNLAISYFGGKQAFASLHAVLSLLAIAFAPPSETTLVIATVIALVSVTQTYRQKWEYHLLLNILGFFAYICYWRFSIGNLSAVQNLFGLTAVAVIGISAAFVHYRKKYTADGFEWKPFLSHLANWLTFGSGLLMFVPGVNWVSAPVAAVAVGIFLTARRAKKMKIRWLFVTDTLVSLFTLYIAVILLLRWNAVLFPVFSLLVLVSLVFTLIMLIQKEKRLFQAGRFFLNLIAAGMIVWNLSMGGKALAENGLQQSGIWIFLFIVLGAFVIYENRKKEDGVREKMVDGENVLIPALLRVLNTGFTGLVCGFIPFMVYYNMNGNLPLPKFINAEYAAAFLLIPTMVLRNRIRNHGLGAGLLLSILLVTGFNWYGLSDMNFSSVGNLLYNLPVMSVIACMAVFSRVERNSAKPYYAGWAGVFLFIVNISVLFNRVLEPVSPLLLGLSWLVLALVFLETGCWIGRMAENGKWKTNRLEVFLVYGAYLMIAGFVLRHVLVHLQSERIIWIFRARFMIGIFALAAFGYLFSRGNKYLEGVSAVIRKVRPLFLELGILFAVLTVAVEFRQMFHPLFWMGFSWVLLLAGWKFRGVSRVKLYSLFFFWLTSFHIPFITSRYAGGKVSGFEADWIIAVAAIALQVLYVILLKKIRGFGDLEWPWGGNWPGKITAAVDKKINLWIFYPMFVSILFFLIWSFDSSILTFLIGIEVVAVFIISLVLRENQFKYLSYVGIIACLVRLIAYDLVKSNTVTKALVCIGVSLLLFGMNILYSKFKERYRTHE